MVLVLTQQEGTARKISWIDPAPMAVLIEKGQVVNFAIIHAAGEVGSFEEMAGYWD